MFAPCVHDFMLHLLQCYFTPQPLMCSVREQQHGSLTCHTVAGHCVMIRVCWRHSESTGVIKWCIGPASLPQICLRLWHRLSQAYVYSHFIYLFIFFLQIFISLVLHTLTSLKRRSLDSVRFKKRHLSMHIPIHYYLKVCMCQNAFLLFVLDKTALDLALGSDFYPLKRFMHLNNVSWKLVDG